MIPPMRRVYGDITQLRRVGRRGIAAGVCRKPDFVNALQLVCGWCRTVFLAGLPDADHATMSDRRYLFTLRIVFRCCQIFLLKTCVQTPMESSEPCHARALAA